MPHCPRARGECTLEPLKPWILYAILAWNTNPLLPEEQKTVLLQFNARDECVSIAGQVGAQVKSELVPFRLKVIACYPCNEFFTEGCPNAAPLKGWKPKVKKG